MIVDMKTAKDHEKVKEELKALAKNYTQKHMNACEDWREGKPVRIWRAENGVVCIEYESGKWWNYKQTASGLEWW